MPTRILILALAISGLSFAEDYVPPPDAKGGWRTLKGAAQIRKTAGIDVAKLDEAFDYVQKTSQHGGLLVVRHGKGRFVYTGLSLFRQLPAGVPGAFRLLANLLAHGRSR